MEYQNLVILNSQLLEPYKNQISFNPMGILEETSHQDLPMNYFRFYQAVSSVYSSKIEGEEIDFDSYFKHRELNVEYQMEYVQRVDDLFEAYEFIIEKPISQENVKLAHALVTRHLLPSLQQGVIRKNPMFVLNEEDKIEYVAANPKMIDVELSKLFQDIDHLMGIDLEPFEVFYFAAYIHLVFVKIHPFQDGNGRIARLLEKWFLVSQLGKVAHSIKLEKNYYLHLLDYYHNIRVLGLEYDVLDYGQCLGFLLMTVKGVEKQQSPPPADGNS